MRYVIGLPLCLVLVSGFLWWNSQGVFHLGAGEATPETSVTAPAAQSPSALSRSPSLAQSMGVTEGSTAFEPILVSPCTLTPIQEQSVASQIDGLLTESLVNLGTKVASGQRLAQLDDQKLRLQIELLQVKAISTSAEKIAKAHFEEADAKVKYAQKANAGGITSVPELEMKTYLAERERFANEMLKAREDREEAGKELEKAKVHLAMHQIRSVLDGQVVKSFKKPGETVKQGETLFRLTRTDRLRIEGFCKVQHAPYLKPGQRVLVEAELQGAQTAVLIGHTGPVNQLAISADGKVLASASDDNTVLLWAWPAGVRLATLHHPAPVHAVDIAFIEDDGKYLIVTGGEDRLLRTWTWSAAGQAQGPVLELAGHEGTVRTVCLSSGGTGLVSGGEDRRVGWWDLNPLPGDNAKVKGLVSWAHTLGSWNKTAHQGAVTSVQLSGGLVVSTGTDNVRKVWEIDGAEIKLLKVHRGRTGDVQRLGSSAEGTRLLLDHGDELRVLDRENGMVLGTLQNTRHVRFEDFACFSPSRRLVLSASADGRLQLWKAPVELQERAEISRAWQTASSGGPVADLGGFEIRHYVLPKAAQARSGVFAPDEAVFFTAGTDRTIRVWTIPPQHDWHPREGVLTYVGSELEPGTDLVHIQAEMDNPRDVARWWRPGSYVHLKIFPAQVNEQP